MTIKPYNFSQLVIVDDDFLLLPTISYEIEEGILKNKHGYGYRVSQVVISACNTRALIIWENLENK